MKTEIEGGGGALTQEKRRMKRENIKIDQKETKTSQQQKARFSSLYLKLRKAAVEANISIKAKLLQLYRDAGDCPHGFDCAQISERSTMSIHMHWNIMLM